MATISDTNISHDEYVDIYTLTGITEGTAIEIVNKSSVEIMMQEADTQPDASSRDGLPISVSGYRSVGTVDSGSSTVWLRAMDRGGKVNVQDIS